jgi:hypothetical protein
VERQIIVGDRISYCVYTIKIKLFSVSCQCVSVYLSLIQVLASRNLFLLSGKVKDTYCYVPPHTPSLGKRCFCIRTAVAFISFRVIIMKSLTTANASCSTSWHQWSDRNAVSLSTHQCLSSWRVGSNIDPGNEVRYLASQWQVRSGASDQPTDTSGTVLCNRIPSPTLQSP